eukprot:COSAG01_NODE_2510_length_7546_cov_498.494427_4_plen_43_part_00
MRPLSAQQLQYAAADAAVLVEIANAMFGRWGHKQQLHCNNNN